MKRNKSSACLLLTVAALLSGCAELPTEYELSNRGYRTIPLRPDTLIASTVDSQSVQVSWTSSAYAVTYVVYYRVGNTVDTLNDSCHKIDTLHNGVTVVSGLTANTRYAFSVVAQNELGRSQPSHCDTASPKTMDLPPGMKRIPGGVFQMGTPEGSQSTHWDDEHPIHFVVLSPFYMDSTETQQSDYFRLTGNNPSRHQDSSLGLPVENITWYDAVRYCNVRSDSEGLSHVYGSTDFTANYENNGYRLPTEAEWEYACRARTSSEWYWGENDYPASDYAHYYHGGGLPDSTDSLSKPVAKLIPNNYGLYDMSGNVNEWCNDWYDYDYYQFSGRSNPLGPFSSPYDTKSLRSGNVIRPSSWMQSATRYNSDPSFFSPRIGFRTVRPVRE
ncbi:MAG: SUMF1/EgtB/PvdO family nonheme iron enzyme [Fibrobacterota bacterium]